MEVCAKKKEEELSAEEIAVSSYGKMGTLYIGFTYNLLELDDRVVLFQ